MNRAHIAFATFGIVAFLGIWVEHLMVTRGRWANKTALLWVYRVAVMVVALISANFATAVVNVRG